MSDRIISYTVTLDGAYKDEDAEYIKNAISMIKGVASVEPLIEDASTHFAVMQARRDLGNKIMDVIYPKESK